MTGGVRMLSLAMVALSVALVVIPAQAQKPGDKPPDRAAPTGVSPPKVVTKPAAPAVPQNYTPQLTGASYNVATIVAAADKGYLSTQGVRKTDFPVTFVSSNATPTDGGFALRSFRFRYTDGDHKLKRMGITPTNSRRAGQTQPNYIVNFHDNDPDDPFTFNATVIDLNGIAIRNRTDATSTAYRQSPPTSDMTTEERGKFLCMDGKGRVPLLTGFVFARDSDSNVREIGAMCVPRMVEMCARVGDGPCIAGSRSRIELAATYETTWKHEGGVDLRTLQGAFGTDGGDSGSRVDLVWVPAGIIDECRLFYGRDIRTLDHNFQGKRFAIMGFRFEFLNTDHHIKEIGVEPQAAGEQLLFQDNDRDDSFQYRVQICFFK